MAELPADYIALTEAAQMICLWSERAFATQPVLTLQNEAMVLRPEIAAVIRAAYDPVLPDQSADASHALRLYARINLQEG
jgi:hypothetical protein